MPYTYTKRLGQSVAIKCYHCKHTLAIGYIGPDDTYESILKEVEYNASRMSNCPYCNPWIGE